jgi:PAS domain S-box-containing protein
MSATQPSRNREGQAAAERLLRDIEMRNGPFVAAVQATRVPMVVTDPTIADNPIIYVNDAFVRMCGYDRNETLGQDYFFLIAQQADPDVADRVRSAMAAEQDFIEEVPFRAKDGREVWVSMFVSPVKEGGRVVQHFASFIDVSQRVARERELHAAQETLDRRVATRTRRLQEVNARLQDEVERRQRAEATLRDALVQGQEDVRTVTSCSER